MKTYKIIILAIVLVLLSTSLTYFFYYQYNVVKIERMPFDFQIKAKMVGFNLDKDKLHFGEFSPGYASATRLINISNNFDFPVNVKGRVYGLNAGDINFERDFLLSPKEHKELTLVAVVPEGTPEGNYSGTIVFLFRKV